MLKALLPIIMQILGKNSPGMQKINSAMSAISNLQNISNINGPASRF